MKYLLTLLAVCVLCLEWTRLAGTVKGINLKDQTVTIEDRDGALFTVPVDYQLSITEKHGELRGLKTLHLGEKIVLTRVIADKPKDDTEGLAPPEPTQRGL